LNQSKERVEPRSLAKKVKKNYEDEKDNGNKPEKKDIASVPHTEVKAKSKNGTKKDITPSKAKKESEHK
jgi:hypothetical protein